MTCPSQVIDLFRKRNGSKQCTQLFPTPNFLVYTTAEIQHSIWARFLHPPVKCWVSDGCIQGCLRWSRHSCDQPHESDLQNVRFSENWRYNIQEYPHENTILLCLPSPNNLINIRKSMEICNGSSSATSHEWKMCRKNETLAKSDLQNFSCSNA